MSGVPGRGDLDARILGRVAARLETVEQLIPPTRRWRTTKEQRAATHVHVIPGPALRRARPGSGVRELLLVAALVASVGLVAAVAGDHVTPTPSAGPSAALPASLQDLWIGLETGASIRLDIRPGPGGSTLIDGDAVRRLTVSEDAGALTIQELSGSTACSASPTATYAWRLGTRGLVLSMRDDACPPRATQLARAWARAFPDLTGSGDVLAPGPYLVDRFTRPFSLDVPPGISLVRSLDPSVTSASSDYWMVMEAGGAALVIVRLEAIPLDACDPTAGERTLAGADPELAAALFASTAGVSVGSIDATNIAGLPAAEFDVTAEATCSQGAQLWVAAPGLDVGRGGESRIAPNAGARVAIVEVAGDLIAIAIHAPAGALAAAEALLTPLRDGVLFE